VAVDGSGNVYVADTGNHRVQVFNFDDDDRSWKFQRFVCRGRRGYDEGQMEGPQGVAVDGDNRVFVADTSHRVQVFDDQGNSQRFVGAGCVFCEEWRWTERASSTWPTVTASRFFPDQSSISSSSWTIWENHSTGNLDFAISTADALPEGLAVDEKGALVIVGKGIANVMSLSGKKKENT
jgi:DNA-binding beta-propeller fold protein YncE